MWFKNKKRIDNLGKKCLECDGYLKIKETVYSESRYKFFVGLECKKCKKQYYVELISPAKMPYKKIE